MKINFTKMHSLGNDFVIIDAITQKFKLSEAYIQKIADRHTGIGCDQVIILEPPIRATSDFYYKIYNSNGKTAEQCINGARCAAKLAFNSGLISKKLITADYLSGTIDLIIENDNAISAKLNNLQPPIEKLLLELRTNKTPNIHEVYRISTGNPHAIIFVDYKKNTKYKKHLENSYYKMLSMNLSKHYVFGADGVNIGFAQIVNKNIKLRVFERGVGETLSCGSNALAAFITARSLNLVDSNALVLFKLGALEFSSENNDIIIKGPVNTVFNGKFNN